MTSQTNGLIPRSGRIAVIGAGAAGLQSARQLSVAGYGTYVYEASDHVAGLWAYSSTPTSLSPIYASLHSNIPKYAMTFERDVYPPGTPTFVPHKAVHKYLDSYAKKHNLLQLVSFNNRVTAICKEKSNWIVSTNKSSVSFDAVFVCNGHFSKPRAWQVDGLEYLEANGIDVRHSVSYRTPLGYERKRILVIGCGPSGIDISLELTKVATKVFVSHSKESPVFETNRPSNLFEVGRIECVLPDGQLRVKNGRLLQIDCVITCTGYRRQYPFLKQFEVGTRVCEDDRVVLGLVRQCVALNDPTLCFIGLPEKAIPFPTFEEQVAFSIAVLQGRISLQQLRALADEERKIDFTNLKKYHVLGKRQWDYICDLAKLAGRPPIRESVIELCWDANKARSADPVCYRNREYALLGNDSGMWSVTVNNANEVYREHEKSNCTDVNVMG